MRLHRIRNLLIFLLPLGACIAAAPRFSTQQLYWDFNAAYAAGNTHEAKTVGDQIRARGGYYAELIAILKKMEGSLGSPAVRNAELTRLIQRYPGRTAAHLFRGFVRDQLGQLQGAVDDFSRFLDKPPRLTPTHWLVQAHVQRAGSNFKLARFARTKHDVAIARNLMGQLHPGVYPSRKDYIKLRDVLESLTVDIKLAQQVQALLKAGRVSTACELLNQTRLIQTRSMFRKACAGHRPITAD